MKTGLRSTFWQDLERRDAGEAAPPGRECQIGPKRARLLFEIGAGTSLRLRLRNYRG